MIEEFQLYIYIGLIALLSLISLILFSFLMIAKSKNKKLEERLANRQEIANESYVKFLNTSRDEAFAYIIDTQNALEKFKARIEPQLDYYNTYGIVVPGLHNILAKEVSEAYEELKTIMPEDNKEK